MHAQSVAGVGGVPPGALETMTRPIFVFGLTGREGRPKGPQRPRVKASAVAEVKKAIEDAKAFPADPCSSWPSRSRSGFAKVRLWELLAEFSEHVQSTPTVWDTLPPPESETSTSTEPPTTTAPCTAASTQASTSDLDMFIYEDLYNHLKSVNEHQATEAPVSTPNEDDALVLEAHVSFQLNLWSSDFGKDNENADDLYSEVAEGGTKCSGGQKAHQRRERMVRKVRFDPFYG